MRITLSLLCAAAVLALGAQPASAGILTVNVNAHVISVNDPSNVLGGQVVVGQQVTGSYGYETTVPNSQPGMPDANYPQGPSQGSMSFSVGPLTFASDPLSPDWYGSFRIAVSNGFQDVVRVFSNANQPFAGTSVYMFINFVDPSGMGLTSDALPTSALDLTRFTTHQVDISGVSPDSFWDVWLEIDSVEVPELAVVVSPASSSFIRQQHIEPVLLLQPGMQFTAVEGSVNGFPLPWYYLSQCYPAPPNSQGRPAIACPDINWLLTGGTNHVVWRVDLMDGSASTKSVDWEMIE